MNLFVFLLKFLNSIIDLTFLQAKCYFQIQCLFPLLKIIIFKIITHNLLIRYYLYFFFLLFAIISHYFKFTLSNLIFLLFKYCFYLVIFHIDY